MLRETDIEIIVNRKSDIEIIKQAIISNKIRFPVLLIEFEDCYKIELSSDYEEWELDSAILKKFPEYELTDNPEKGRKEIRLQISRTQSPFATDNWGRPIEDPTNETKYLVKKSTSKIEKFIPEVKVLFENKEVSYYVNIVNGIDKSSDEKGFLLVKDFKIKYLGGKVDIRKDRLYKSRDEAFNEGCYILKEQANIDFKEYLDNKKKEIRKRQRIPRKIISDFIKSCNDSDIEGILKNIDDNIVFEKTIDWQRQLIFESIDGLKEYISLPEQELCSKELSINSNWIFDLPRVSVWIDYNATSSENSNMRKYEKWNFVLGDNKIMRITKME